MCGRASVCVCVRILRIYESVKKRSCNYLAKTRICIRIQIRLRFRCFSFILSCFSFYSHVTFQFDKFTLSRLRRIPIGQQLFGKIIAAAFNQLDTYLIV